jgi:photosystem II stability/assembly factor-like uncharacterized protein
MPRFSILRLLGIIMVDIFMSLGGAAPLRGNMPTAWPDTYVDDANLHAICMLDDAIGWTVGDRGAIWHTKDSGTTWIRQRAPLGCTLYDVDFSDQDHGCIVGSYYDNYGLASHGVVLFTKNGGKTWDLAQSHPPSQLRRIVCVDAKSYFAAGSPSLWDGRTIFHSQDGGASWQSVDNRSNVPWTCRLPSDANGYFAGADGAFFRVTSQPTSQLAISKDGSRTWQDVNLGIGIGARMGWRALAGASQGPTIAIIGNPGSIALVSRDQGQTWSVRPTGQTLPLKDIQVTGTQTVWAVGSLSTILKSTDGGTTWNVSRAGGRHLAAMGYFATEEEIPFEVVSGISLGLPLYSRVVIDHLATRKRPHGVSPLGMQSKQVFEVCHDSIVHAGGAGVDLLGEDPMTNQLRLACCIRSWQPSIILIRSEESPSSIPSDLTKNIRDGISLAIAESSAPADLAAVLDELYLPPIPRPILLKLSQQKLTSESRRISTTGPAMGLDGSTESWGEERACDLNQAPYRAAFEWWYRGAEDGGNTPPSLLRALGPAPRDGRQNRRATAWTKETLAHAEPAAFHDDTSRVLIARFLSSGRFHMQTHEQLQRLTLRFPPEEAARLALFTAEQSWLKGETRLAMDIWRTTASGDSKLAATQYALRLLAAHDASTESELMRKTAVEKITEGMVHRGIETMRFDDTLTSRDAASSAEIAQAADMAESSGKDLHAKVGQANKYENARDSFARLLPTLQQAPEMQLVQLAQRRKSSTAGDTTTILRRNLKLYSDPDWRRRFLEELMVSDGGRDRLSHRIQVPMTPRPHLDGQFEDATWEHVETLVLPQLEDGPSKRQSHLQFGRDDRYFYIGVECERMGPPADTKREPGASVTRVRDPDLTGCDRVELVLDVDRDHMTRWTLILAQDGQVAESFEGNPAWNPQWYVAHHGDETHWRMEAAIPLAELGVKSHHQEPWLMGVQRAGPSGLWTSWPIEAGYGLFSQQLGYLFFSKPSASVDP